MNKLRSRVSRLLIDSLETRTLMSVSPLAPSVAHAHLTVAIQSGLNGRPAPAPVNGATSALLAPTNVKATALSQSQVKITWTASLGASNYYIYRSINGGNFSQVVKLGSSSSYTDSGLLANTAYSYYIVAAKKNNLSAASAVTSATTPSPAPIPAPNVPTNLTVAGTTTNSVSLTWSDNATNESGYRVYRSGDGSTYSLVASLSANAQSYTDAGLPSDTDYFYTVAAWNTSGETTSSSVTASTASTVTTDNPINIFTRYGGEVVIAGTSGNDSIFVSQSGSTLTIIANGITSTANAGYALFIYSDGGADTITVDSSVTLRTTIATIDGGGSTVSNANPNASIWADATDSYTGPGTVHRVTSFYQGVSKAVGINIADPFDAGSTFRANASLWGTAPSISDVNQGGVGDCYLLASLGGFAWSMPSRLTEMAVDLGDGTYVVQYQRSGTTTFVRVDGDISSGAYWGYAYAHPGASGNIWAMIMEKSYAYFRSGANSYASLSSGWMSNVYSDLGINNTNISLSTAESTFSNSVANALNTGKAVTFGTNASPPNVVGNHAYTLVSVTTNGSGQKVYTLRNPWGFAGTGYEDGAGYITLTFAQMQANFTLGTLAV